VNKHLSLLTTAILPIILISCSRGPQYPAVLETADSLAYVNPDSAVALLRSVEAEMIASQPAVRHLYDLMTLKAQDKADLPLTSDSLILDILQYYEHGGDPNKLPEAYYYAGRVYRELGDAPQAIDYFQKAQTTLDTLDLRELPVPNAKRYEKLKGIILAQKGYLLRNQHLYQEALDCFNQAYTYNSLVLDTIGMFLDLKDAGGVLSAARDNEQAIHYFDLAAQLAAEYSDSINLDLLTAQKCQCLIWLKRFDEVAKCLQTFQPRITRANFQFMSNMYGEYYWKIGESEKAVPYFKKLYEMGSVYARKNATLWFSDFEMKRGNAKEALRYMAEFSNLELEVRKLRDEEMIALSNSLYNYHLREQENLLLKAKQEALKIRLRFLSIIAILLIIALFYIIRYEKNKRQDMASHYEQLQYLLASIEADKEQRQSLVNAGMSALRSSDTYQMIMEKCRDGKALRPEEWKIVEQTIQQHLPNFLTNLKGVYKFSEVEWRASLLMKYGIPVADIATAVCRSKDCIYSLRSRLHKKAFREKNNFKSWQDFIESL
jgi:TPR repeat protein